MSYLPSINIEYNNLNEFNYIITENARTVAGNIVNSFRGGFHCFSIIGTYGTGKSSFILALEKDLQTRSGDIINSDVFGSECKFEFMNVVGEYSSLSNLLSKRMKCEQNQVLEKLDSYYKDLHLQNTFLIIVVDEFGKVLEHAAKNNPEKELYFLQKLCEYINVPSRHIMLLTTLHQNFGSYSYKLSETQKHEWSKVKGRFHEIVFAEPVEQLLYLTAQQLGESRSKGGTEEDGQKVIYELGIRSKILSNGFSLSTARKLSPLDPISAVGLTLSIQRYGQNERSLFSFLAAQGDGSISEFREIPNQTFNLAMVYDYVNYHFYTAINELNADSVVWRSIRVALDRVEGTDLSENVIENCKKLVKTVGMANLFFSGIHIDKPFLLQYGKYCLGLENTSSTIDLLESLKVLRFAKYKSQYILYEGTDLNIDNELYKAASIVPEPQLFVSEIAPYVRQKVSVASASYYKKGTPRFFEYRVFNDPVIVEAVGDIDGFISLIFPLADIEESVIELSKSKASGATLFGYYKDTDNIVKHLYEIKKLNYVLENVAVDDKVAETELRNQKVFESLKLNEAIQNSFVDGSVVWYFKGRRVNISSLRDFNKALSLICDEIYQRTPIVRNELFNRQKLSSAISLARVNLLDAMLRNSGQEAFGIEGFPPEKAIYYTLFRESGIHRQNASGLWELGAPTAEGLRSLWDISVDFVSSSVDKPRKLSELAKILSCAPFKLKQGVIDFWIPIFLYINQQSFALYNDNHFVLEINKEVFELLQKRLKDFSIKAFRVSGVKLEFFKRYRQFLKKDVDVEVSADSLLETVKPFFHFYKGLNPYAKHTRKFDSAYTAKFRDVLSDATDPAKTFFEDLPAALGYKDLNDEEFVSQYLELIRNSVRELNLCYDNLIDRIEDKIIDHLGVPENYSEYKPMLTARYSSIDPRILTPKTRSFLDRIISPSETKREFIEKIAIVVSDKRLEEIKDSEEPLLIHQILHILSELERFSSISKTQSQHENAEAYSFELASSRGKFSHSKTYRLPNNKAKKAEEVIRKIDDLMTDDEELNICILLNLLNRKV